MGLTLLRKIGEQSPFLEKLIRVTHPVGFKQLGLLKYDIEKGDLVTHLWEFKNTLLQHEYENLFRKLFPATFTGEALTWFTDLKPKFIDSWVQFSQIFMDRIIHNCLVKKTLKTLYLLLQRESESLVDFLQRFQDEVADIPKLSEESCIKHFKTTL